MKQRVSSMNVKSRNLYRGREVRKKLSTLSASAAALLKGSEARETVRCPYCVLGLESRLMVAHVDRRYICGKCGHTAYPVDVAYECRCPKCLELAGAQIASRATQRG